MGPGGSDCTLNVAWVRRLQYEDPKVWFVAGKGRDPVTFAGNDAFCLPGGGYILRKKDSHYCFPIAAVDLSTGLDRILTMRVPFKGSFPLPDGNMSTETRVDGTESHHALSWHLLAIKDLASRGRMLEITLADETQSTVLSFEVEGALAKTSDTARESTTNSSETVRARAASVSPKNRNEALRSAALEGDLDLVTALLDAGADPKWVDKNGDNALMLAIASGNVKVVEHLLNAGSNVSNSNHDGETPLILAGGVGRASIVCLLLQAGADKNAADERGITALMLAAENVDTAGAVDALLQAGADPNLKDKKGRTALQIGERSRKLNRSGAEEVINLLKPVTKP
jgi:ankyrin repeat protein